MSPLQKNQLLSNRLEGLAFVSGSWWLVGGSCKWLIINCQWSFFFHVFFLCVFATLREIIFLRKKFRGILVFLCKRLLF